MKEKLTSAAKWLGFLGIAVLGLILRGKWVRLKELEAKAKIEEMDREISGLREEVQGNAKRVAEKEKTLRVREAEYRHALRKYESERNGDGNA